VDEILEVTHGFNLTVFALFAAAYFSFVAAVVFAAVIFFASVDLHNFSFEHAVVFAAVVFFSGSRGLCCCDFSLLQSIFITPSLSMPRSLLMRFSLVAAMVFAAVIFFALVDLHNFFFEHARLDWKK